MSDDVVQRVGQALCDIVRPRLPGQIMSGDDFLEEAQAALAAIQPGDELGNGNFVINEPYWINKLSDDEKHRIRQAAEAVRGAFKQECRHKLYCYFLSIGYSSEVAKRVSDDLSESACALDLSKIVEGYK